jgi:hypothetical protein
MLVFLLHLNLIVVKETIREGKYLIVITLINDIINEWGRLIILRTCFVKIHKINTNVDGTLFFGNWYRI